MSELCCCCCCVIVFQSSASDSQTCASFVICIPRPSVSNLCSICHRTYFIEFPVEFDEQSNFSIPELNSERKCEFWCHQPILEKKEFCMKKIIYKLNQREERIDERTATRKKTHQTKMRFFLLLESLIKNHL